MIKRILVGICDPQHTAASTFHAKELALRFEAKVTAIAVTDIDRLTDVGPVALGAGSFAKEMIEERVAKNDEAVRKSLEVLVHQLSEANVSCRVIENGGDAIDALIHASRYHDLMIFGLRGLFQHGVGDEPSNALVHLIESGVRPILGVGPTQREIKRIFIAYSGSVESAKTVKNFANMKLWPKAKLRVVHFGSPDGKGASLLAESQSYLRDHGFEVETELIDDIPKTQLLRYAEDWRSDLIVIGNSGKAMLRRKVFGETALNVMRESRLPLFLSQ